MAIKIKEARLKAKMSEKELAQACGQNINYILQIESGKKVINEKIAEDILKILGEKVDFFQDVPETQSEPTAIKPVVKPAQTKSADLGITPNDAWTGALSGVIKNFPVIEEVRGNVVTSKELSIIGKKIEGVHHEKIGFVKVTDSDMPKLRIAKGDILTIHLMGEIQSQGIYYFEFGQKKMIRQLIKSQNNKVLFSRGPSEPETEVDVKNIKVIGKVIKVEFYL
jgi:transcriptional regulator with XRE-family HTH domain